MVWLSRLFCGGVGGVSWDQYLWEPSSASTPVVPTPSLRVVARSRVQLLGLQGSSAHYQSDLFLVRKDGGPRGFVVALRLSTAAILRPVFLSTSLCLYHKGSLFMFYLFFPLSITP